MTTPPVAAGQPAEHPMPWLLSREQHDLETELVAALMRRDRLRVARLERLVWRLASAVLGLLAYNVALLVIAL